MFFKRKKDASAFQEVELKPCPFCGGMNLIYKHDAKQKLHYVGCVPCFIFAASGNAELSVSRWNERKGVADRA